MIYSIWAKKLHHTYSYIKVDCLFNVLYVRTMVYSTVYVMCTNVMFIAMYSRTTACFLLFLTSLCCSTVPYILICLMNHNGCHMAVKTGAVYSRWVRWFRLSIPRRYNTNAMCLILQGYRQVPWKSIQYIVGVGKKKKFVVRCTLWSVFVHA